MAMSEEGPVHEQVYRRLREAIATGRFVPGRSVTLRGIAEDLGVSAMPVREAIRRLVAERALEMHKNRRISVPHMTRQRFEELVAARTLLEPEAAVRTLPHATGELIDNLIEIDNAIDVSLQNGDSSGYVAQNRDFHFLLYSSSQTQVLLPLIESVWLQTGPFMRVVYGRIGTSFVVDQHKAAIEALKARDANALRAAIRADILDGMNCIGSELLSSAEGENPDEDDGASVAEAGAIA